jgi:hypothetical protein
VSTGGYGGPVVLGLDAAIDAVYDAFAGVPKPAAIDACPGCFTADDEAVLLQALPLRALPPTAFSQYSLHVALTAGGGDDFRYFLPRMLEVSVTEGFGGPELGLCGFPTIDAFLGRLRYAGWSGWARLEQAAVREFLAALWYDTIAAHPDDATFIAADVLCGIGGAEDDLTPYLAMWAALLPGANAAAHLAEQRAQRHVNAFWDDREAQFAQVTAWLADH